MTLPEIKPCPFCGKAPTLRPTTATEHPRVVCIGIDCAVNPTAYGRTEQDVIERWNKRAGEAA